MIYFILAVIGIIAFFAYRVYFPPETKKDSSKVNRIKTLPPVSQRLITPQKNTAPQKPNTPEKTMVHHKDRPQWKWMGFGEQLRVGSYVIKDPLTYYSHDNPGSGVMTVSFNIGEGTSSTSYPHETDEASCIYQNLSIGTPLDEKKGALGYWPKYSTISPNQRANYIEWLASGKRGNLSDIGYAFLYFYGLERRALLEKKDINLIIRLTLRLLGKYRFSESFNGYLGSFIAYLMARVGIDRFNEQWFNLIFNNSSICQTEEGLAVLLAWFHLNKKPLPHTWARRVAELDQRSSRSVVTERVPEEFNELFSLKYQNRYKQGMHIEATTKDRAIYYTPASPTMPKPSFNYDTHATIREAIIPNAIGQEDQFTPLVNIWSECIEELKPLSRKISKNADTHTIEAYNALPEPLKTTTEHPLQAPWEKVVTSKRREDGFALMKISTLARLLKIEERARLTAKQSEHIGETSEHIGYAIEPDARITGQSYKWDDVVALFRTTGDRIISGNREYLSASLIMELGLAVASADGIVDKKEIAHVGGFLKSLFMLETIDYQRLEALKRVYIQQPPSLYNLANRIKRALPVSNLEKIGFFLIGVASADGVIDPNEITVLRRIYKALGIEKEKLDEILNSVAIPQEEPVVVRERKDQKPSGELIPPQQIQAQDVGINIDPKILGIIMAESEIVREILDETYKHDRERIAKKDYPKTTTPLKVRTNPTLRKLGLDNRYHIVFINLIKKKTWQKDVLESVLKENGFMIEDTIERINDWAIETFNDPFILAEQERLSLNLSILEKIRNEQQN